MARKRARRKSDRCTIPQQSAGGGQPYIRADWLNTFRLPAPRVGMALGRFIVSQ
jgi:hypothetical protein